MRDVGQRLFEPRVDLRQVGLDRGRVDGLALGQGDDRQQRRGVAAGAAVALGDRLTFVSQPSLSGTENSGLERLGGGAGGGHRRRSSATIQVTTTMRLWARTQRVSDATDYLQFEVCVD